MKKISSAYFRFWGSVFSYRMQSSAKLPFGFESAKYTITSSKKKKRWISIKTSTLGKNVNHFSWVVRFGSGAVGVINTGCLPSSSCSCDIGEDALTRSKLRFSLERKHLFAKKGEKTSRNYQFSKAFGVYAKASQFTQTQKKTTFACLLRGCHLMLQWWMADRGRSVHPLPSPAVQWFITPLLFILPSSPYLHISESCKT